MSKKKIIINADDCGKDVEVDGNIRKAILAGKISSASIIANMNDFDGAIRLYNEYKESISFGWHINLTEGEPLLKSQMLLDVGFYKEQSNRIIFNGQQFRQKWLNAEMRREIRKELISQWEKLHDHGIMISHADSHHHIHTAPSMLCLMVSLFKELKIERCRHIKNYGVSFLSYTARNMWAIPFKISGIRMPDNLGDFVRFYNAPNMRQGSIIELECHPGHPRQEFQDEMKLVYSTDLSKWDADLISYNNI